MKKVEIEQLPDDFKMSDKQILILIRDLFEMVKTNNELIKAWSDSTKLIDKYVKTLQKKG
jgi:hypothetical protein